MTAAADFQKKLKILTLAFVGAVTLFQVISVFVWGTEQVSDAESYVTLGRLHAAAREFYPSGMDMYNSYIFNPGWVNFLTVCFSLTSSVYLPMFCNIGFNLIVAYCTYFISKKLFESPDAGYYAVIAMYLLLTNSAAVLSLLSELPYAAAAFLGIAVLVSEVKGKYFVSGALMAVANWIRPLALAFILAIIVYLFIKKVKFRETLKFSVSAALVVAIIGTAGYVSCGKFVYAASTGGFNLIMSAIPEADGTYSGEPFQPGNAGYLTPEQKETMTFEEKNDFWMEQSIELIKNDPWHYIKQTPMKVFVLLSTETYNLWCYTGFTLKTSAAYYVREVASKLLHFRLGEMQAIDWATVYNQAVYMLISAMGACGFVMLLRRKKEKLPQIALLTLIFIFGCGMTIVTVGSARYHNPYLPIYYIYCGVCTDFLVKRFREKKTGRSEKA